MVGMSDPDDDALVCLECGHPDPHDVQRGQCRHCDCDAPRYAPADDAGELPVTDAWDDDADDDAGEVEDPRARFNRPAAAPNTIGRFYDWPKIKARYVEGVKDDTEGLVVWPSLAEVADHFGVIAVRVKERSSREGWVAQRSAYQAQVEATRQHAKAAAMSRESTQLDSTALTASKTGLQLCIAKLSEIGSAAQKARTAAGPGGGSGGVIDALEQQRLAAAVDLWYKIGLRAVGDPELHRLEITGANGAPIEIAAELRRDDPTRLAGVLGVLAQAGLGDLFAAQTVPGEVVE